MGSEMCIRDSRASAASTWSAHVVDSTASDIQLLSACGEGDDLRVAYQRDNSGTTELCYAKYDAGTDSWSVEVVGTEEVTVPAGTYNCYKVVYTEATSGTTITEYWAADQDLCAPVKVVDEDSYKYPETRELASYTPGGTTQ